MAKNRNLKEIEEDIESNIIQYICVFLSNKKRVQEKGDINKAVALPPFVVPEVPTAVFPRAIAPLEFAEKLLKNVPIP